MCVGRTPHLHSTFIYTAESEERGIEILAWSTLLKNPSNVPVLCSSAMACSAKSDLCRKIIMHPMSNPESRMLPSHTQVWNVEGEGRKLGILVRTLVGHGHRINTLALSCEATLRTGPFGKEECALKVTSTFTAEEAQQAALERYNLTR